MHWQILNLFFSFIECFLFVVFVVRYNGIDWLWKPARIAFFATLFSTYGFIILEGYLHFGMGARILIRTALVFVFALYFLKGSMIGKVLSCLFFPVILSITQVFTAITIARILNLPLGQVWNEPGVPRMLFQLFSMLILFYVTRVFVRYRQMYHYPYKKIHVLLSSMIPIITILFICSMVDILMEETVSGSSLLMSVLAVTGILIINVIIYYLFSRIGHESELEIENQMLRHYLEYERRHMEEQKRLYDQLRSLRHEMRNHLSYMEQLLAGGRTEEALSLIHELSGEVERLKSAVQTDNETLNFILNSHLALAAEKEIPYKVQISDTQFQIRDIDLHSMLGNMLNNALESVSALPREMRDLVIIISRERGYHSFTVKNRIASSVLKENPELQTTKDDISRHGLGVSIIRSIVSRYQGHLDYYEQDGYFCMQVLIPEGGIAE